MKTILFSLLLSVSLFAATAEQVEHYLNVSNAEEQLIEMETAFSSMQNSLKAKESNATENKTYDMQLLSIRFREYLQKALSQEEMDAVLENYKNMVLLQFVSVTGSEAYDPKKVNAYVKQLESDTEAQDRIALIEKITKALYKKESIAILFDNLMKPLMQNGIGDDKLDDAFLEQSRKNYIKMMLETSRKETLYAVRDFSDEELESLLKIAKNPATDHETKAVFGATAYALKEFFMSLASRFDVKKHQMHTPSDSNKSR